jgi:hypothetical protein
MDKKGQLTGEYLLIIGFSILISISIAYTAGEVNELNTIMAVARNGAVTGSYMDSLAFYPTEKFEEYSNKYPRLKSSSKVVFIKMDYKNEGFDKKYQKIKLKLKILASAPSLRNDNEKICAGDRINYYTRKSICEAFQTEPLTNIYYNPAFSNRYVITTADVEWIS